MNTGLFFCRGECLGGQFVDADALASRHRDAAAVCIFDNLFDGSSIETMVQEVRRKSLDSVVLAACSPLHYQNTLAGYRLSDRLEEAGVNPNRIAYANLKEQCAMPHSADLKAANAKAALMVDKAMARLRLSPAVQTLMVAPHRAVLIIGGTLGGLVAAYRATRLGYRVFLLDKALDLTATKGHMTDLRPLLGELGLNQGVEFLLGRDVKDVSGWCGDYTIEVEGGGGVRRVQVGGILVAVADDPEWVRTLAPKLHVKLDDRGDFLRRNDTTMAVRTDDDGIFAVCRAEDGASARAEIADASNAIVILDGILSQNEISHPMRMSEVDRELCGACGTCVKTCAFHACRIDATDRVSVIDERRCKACGNCVTACPTGARDLVTYPNAYIAEAIKICAQFQANGAPKALCFLCNGCGYPAADAAGLGGHSYPVSILPLRVACGGRVDTQHILEAYRYGFDGVMVTVCREGHCHNIVGNVDMNRRLNLFRAVLTSRELDPERLRIVEIAPYEGARFAQEATRFVKDLAAMAKTGA